MSDILKVTKAVRRVMRDVGLVNSSYIYTNKLFNGRAVKCPAFRSGFTDGSDSLYTRKKKAAVLAAIAEIGADNPEFVINIKEMVYKRDIYAPSDSFIVQIRLKAA